MDLAMADLILLRNALDVAILYENSSPLLNELYLNLYKRICHFINSEKDKNGIIF